MRAALGPSALAAAGWPLAVPGWSITVHRSRR
jgi:hypothetical protein